MTTQEALNAIAEAQRLDVVRTVTMQPHRRFAKDPQDPLLGTAIGRFIVAHRMAREIAAGAEVYGEAKGKWLAAKGAPRGSKFGGAGGEIDEAQVAKWKATWRGIEYAICSVAGVNALSLIEGAIMMEFDIPANHHVPNVIKGLVEMAYATAKLERPRA